MSDPSPTNIDLLIASLIEKSFPGQYTEQINKKFGLKIAKPASHESMVTIVEEGNLSFPAALTVYVYFYLHEMQDKQTEGEGLKYIRGLLKLPPNINEFVKQEITSSKNKSINALDKKHILFSPNQETVDFINHLAIKANEIGLSQKKKTLSGLVPEVFEHPLDRVTLNRLKKLPGFDKLITKFVQLKKKEIELNCLASNLEVNSKSFPYIYEILREACGILDLDEIPSLYIEQGFINGYTIGVDKNIIVISSGAVSCLTRNELLYLIGHEIGHIKCKHVLYSTILKLIASGSIALSSITLGLGGLLTAPLLSGLYYWSRCSELSADRAGLLCCQNKIDVIRTIIKVSGYPLKHYGQIDVQSYVDQANKLRKQIKEEALDSILYGLNVIFSSHPKNVIRASELLKWIEEGEYEDLCTYTREEFQTIKENLQNPLILSLQDMALDMLAEWITGKEEIETKIAKRYARKLILIGKTDPGTFTDTILRIDLNIKKTSPNEINFQLMVIYHEDEKVLKTKIENSRPISWDDLSSEARKEFIKSNANSLNYIIYDKQV